MLKVRELSVEIENNRILNNINLEIPDGEIHVLMGKNGSGKSTLAQTIMGNPMCKISSGEIYFKGKNISDLNTENRAKQGIFLSFQNPIEIPGVNIFGYLRTIYNQTHENKLSPVKFREHTKKYLEMLDLKDDIYNRFLNEGFSGGEKKKLELLQCLVLEPRLIILDEIDSGLDVEALKIIGEVLNRIENTTILIITHYARILKYLSPSRVHIMSEGTIIKSGDINLIDQIEEKGFK